MSIDGRMGTHCGIFVSLEKGDMQAQAIPGMTPEDIMLREMSPSQQDKQCMMIPLICGPPRSQIHRDRK